MGDAKGATVRSESDSFGSIDVPGEHHWGAQTARSLQFFSIGDETMPTRLIHALALVKRSAAQANAELGLLSKESAALIVKAADEIMAGDHADEFPLSVWQTGSGTQSNMNVNEVIASRANEIATGRRGGKSPIHPNDHVNLSQSSNDVFPTAIHVAAVSALADELLPALRVLQASVSSKATAWSDIVKIGRTHLQDAVPLTLGQEFGAHASAIGANIVRVEAAAADLHQLALGGTAVGTGLNSHPQFGSKAIEKIAQESNHPFVGAPDRFAALAGHEPVDRVGLGAVGDEGRHADLGRAEARVDLRDHTPGQDALPAERLGAAGNRGRLPVGLDRQRVEGGRGDDGAAQLLQAARQDGGVAGAHGGSGGVAPGW